MRTFQLDNHSVALTAFLTLIFIAGPGEAEPRIDIAQNAPQPVPQADTSPNDPTAAQMTRAELDAVRWQIASNWYLDPTRIGAEDLLVEVRVMLAQDGNVLTAVVIDQARTATDSNYREAADAAIRAVRKSSPLKLPPEKYAIWKTLLLHFNAHGMLGN
jgi:hypothetical protein